VKKPKFMDLVYACIALAFLVGAVQAHWGIVLSAAKMCAIALLVMVLGYGVLKALTRVAALKKPAWVPESPEGTVPRYGSRRWARANYWSGVIDLQELNEFYATHPERMDDPDR